MFPQLKECKFEVQKLAVNACMSTCIIIFFISSLLYCIGNAVKYVASTN